jgi:hypothetical protein
MSVSTPRTPVRATYNAQYQNAPVNVKVLLSALWVAMLFVFAYVDIFGFFRADVLNAAIEGEVGSTGLEVSQVILTATLIYVLPPILMVVLSLVLAPRANRITNIAVSLLYTATVLGSCIGETWVYYLIGSGVEALLLLVIARTAWKWPRC